MPKETDASSKLLSKWYSGTIVYSRWSCFLLLFEAGLDGQTTSTRVLLGVSFFLMAHFFLSVCTVCSMASGHPGSSRIGAGCTAWIERGSLDPVPDLVYKVRNMYR